MPSARHLVLTCSALIIAFSSPASGQAPCESRKNLTGNCAFNVDIANWVQEKGDSFNHVTDGYYDPGSIEINSFSGGMGQNLSIHQCVDGLVDSAVLGSGYWVSVVSGSANKCGLTLTQYSGSGCFGYVGSDFVETAGLDAGWNRVQGEFPTAPGSVEVRVSCSGDFDFTVRIDDIYLGEGLGSAIFSDGFEQGDTGRWSSATPP